MCGQPTAYNTVIHKSPFYGVQRLVYLSSQPSIIKKETSTTHHFRSLIPINMCLICLKFIDLIFINRLRMSMTFYRKYTFCYCNVLSCFFSMTPTHIDPAGFYVNSYTSTGMRIFIGEHVQTLYCPSSSL